MTTISDDVRAHLAIVAETCVRQAHLPDRPLDDRVIDTAFLFLYHHYVLGLDTPDRKAAYKARVAYNARRTVEAPDDENLGDA